MRPASLRLRLLAALVDAAVFIGVIAALVGLGIAGSVAYGRVRRKKTEEEDDEDAEPDDDELEADDEPEDDEDVESEDEWEGDTGDERSGVDGTALKVLRSPHLQAALRGVSVGLAVAARNVRGPGSRVVGLRRVDANTGGAVSIRSALIGASFDQVSQAVTRQLLGSPVQRQQDRMSELKPQLREVEQAYANDPDARQRAVMEFYKANKVNPLAGCGRHLAGLVALQLVLALGSRRGQTVRDRLTGTRVIVDR